MKQSCLLMEAREKGAGQDISSHGAPCDPLPPAEPHRLVFSLSSYNAIKLKLNQWIDEINLFPQSSILHIAALETIAAFNTSAFLENRFGSKL